MPTARSAWRAEAAMKEERPGACCVQKVGGGGSKKVRYGVAKGTKLRCPLRAGAGEAKRKKNKKERDAKMRGDAANEVSYTTTRTRCTRPRAPITERYPQNVRRGRSPRPPDRLDVVVRVRLAKRNKRKTVKKERAAEKRGAAANDAPYTPARTKHPPARAGTRA